MSVAAHKGREEIVKMLIAADADVNIDSNNGSTPLIQASHFGRFACRLVAGFFAWSMLCRLRRYAITSRFFSVLPAYTLAYCSARQ